MRSLIWLIITWLLIVLAFWATVWFGVIAIIRHFW
jgi:hypothetical protein